MPSITVSEFIKDRAPHCKISGAYINASTHKVEFKCQM